MTRQFSTRSRVEVVILIFTVCAAFFCPSRPAVAADPSQAVVVRLGTFVADATPPLGSPVAYATAREIVEPLSARGVVLLPGGQKPIVLCAVDWIGIGNRGYDLWREELAKGAGTSPDRVAVHSLHQHDAPRCDLDAQKLLGDEVAAQFFDEAFQRRTVQATASAVREAIEDAKPVTHLGVGVSEVEKVASNRRLLGPDGKVRIMRWSSSRNTDAIQAPEGLIDPLVRMVSFWHGEEPLAVLTYYATHPQSYYGQGDVNPEFVGMARRFREEATNGTVHIHFNGAGGNVAAGKYNDGSEKMRPILAKRLAEGMRQAWERTKQIPLLANQVEWRTVPVALPPGLHLEATRLRAILDDPDRSAKELLAAALHLAWLQRCEAGETIPLTCLDLAHVSLVHMPGELFVEYQLAAQKMQPERIVCMAAYGDYGPGYIGVTSAYAEGGYEVSPGASRVAPQVESVLMPALAKLLEANPVDVAD